MRYCMQFDNTIRSYAIYVLVTVRDKVISKSYKYIDLTL